MRNKKALSILSMLTVMMMVGFQNCSKIGVSDLQNMDGKVDGNGAAIVDDSEMPPVPPAPPADDADEPKKDVADKDCDKDKDHDKSPIPRVPGQPDMDADTGKLPNDADLQAMCLKEIRGGVAGPEIEHHRGIAVVESDLLTRVEDIRGIMVIRGKSAAAEAKLIRNFRGALIVCGMDIVDVDDFRGQLVLVDSKLAHLNNARGVVKLIRSEVGDMKDVKGAILEKSNAPKLMAGK